MDPASNDDPPASHLFPVSQDYTESFSILFDFSDLPLFQVRHGLRLEPATVGYEAFNRNRATYRHAPRSLKGVDRQRPRGIGQMRCLPRRSQAHALGHVALPERHRLTTHTEVHALRIQMRRCEQAVWASTHNHHHIT